MIIHNYLQAALLHAAVTRGHIDATGTEIRALGQQFGATIQRFSNVATPSPMPGVGESPLMTWGEIEGMLLFCCLHTHTTYMQAHHFVSMLAMCSYVAVVLMCQVLKYPKYRIVISWHMI
jgi:hypothetical protein